jgi:hypothetical protein
MAAGRVLAIASASAETGDVARLDAAQGGGSITGQRTAIAEDPTLTGRHGDVLLEISGALSAANSAQHSLAPKRTGKRTDP